MKIEQLTPGKVFPLAGIITPIAAVILMRILLNGGPSESPAATLETPGPFVALEAGNQKKPLSEQQKAALEYACSAHESYPLSSPMAKPSAPLVSPDPVIPELLEPKPDDPSEHLVLTSIVGRGERALASLSGKVYRVGDEVGPSWHLTTINTEKREIIITSDDGETRVMQIKQDMGR